MAIEGLNQREVSERLGIDRSNLSRQLARHDAQALVLQRKAELAESLDNLTEQARRRAMTCALDLMKADQPIEYRARMVELFVRSKLIVAPVNVNIAMASSPDLGGYAYRRPALDVTPTDHKSGNVGEDD
jgi:hypothetical protein